MSIFNIEDYFSVVKENEFYNRALCRTNLNINILIKRFGEIQILEENMQAEFKNCFRAIIWNHIIQTYYKKYRADIIPESCGDMYGYFVMIVQRKGMKYKRLANLTSGSLRIDLMGNSYEILNELYKEKDLLVTLFKTMNFIENKVFEELEFNVKLNKDEKYLSVYQVLTMAICMGVIDFWILGATSNPKFLLTKENKYGMLYLNYFEIRLTSDKRFYIERKSGDMYSSEGKILAYNIWCKNNIGQGINTLIALCEKNECPILFTASIGGYFGTSYNIEIDFLKETCIYSVFDKELEDNPKTILKLNKAKIKKLGNNIQSTVTKWDKHDETEENILDGTNWSVNLVTNFGTYNSSASNSYPEDWDIFCNLISEGIGRVFQ